jgi:methionyl aminopeptidase
MIDGGKILADVKRHIKQFAQTESSFQAIDQKAENLIIKAGAKPSFKMVPGYSWTTCINTNDGIVHGIPKGHLKKGDFVTIDMGVYYQGFHTDSAMSFIIGKPTKEQENFLKVGEKVLAKTIKKAVVGNRIKDLSQSMQQGIQSAGFNVVRELTGHGVGEELHQEPSVPCFVSNHKDMKVKLFSGMTIAIEVMYVAGDWPLIKDSDGWTLRTRDGKLSAVVEETVLVTNNQPIALTAL